MNQIKKDLSLFQNPVFAFLFAGSFLAGLFHEPAGALCSVILTILLCVRFAKKKVELSLNVTTVTVALITLSFLIVSIWATDRYYAVLGFIKFFPLLLFYLMIGSQNDFDGERILLFIPYSAAIMTVVSFIFSRIESTAYLFSVDGRIAGFFQYPNTFALYLILGIVVLAFQPKTHVIYYIFSAVMIFGIFMSGSRTSFVVFMITVLVLLFVGKHKKLQWMIIGISAAFVIIALLIFLFSSRRGAFGRFLSISLSSGTFNARLLYMKDALRYILKHPFGIGYMGYYFSQGSFQTGFYTNRFIHNDWLQIIMDIGWIPSIAAAICIIKAFACKQKALVFKFLLAVILAHALFEFDFQFLIIGFIVLICLREDSAKTVVAFRKPAKRCLLGLICGICCLSVYFGASSAAYLLNRSDLAAKICKHNTMAQIERLKNARDVSAGREIAQIILENNASVPNAHFALADDEYQKGDIRQFSNYALQSIQLNRYNTEAYQAYASRLLNAVKYYESHSQTNQAKECAYLLVSLQQRMALTAQREDPLAKNLPDRVPLAFDQQTTQAITELKQQYIKE